jgi:murein DD-endopeptidase MepM/ murein hydrolase activator NlpD
MITDALYGNSSRSAEARASDNLNSQNLPLLQNSANFDLLAARGGGDIVVVDNNEALMSENGPSGTLADISDTANTGQISKYTVRKGDSLSSIAKMFGVSVNTIVWANNVSSQALNEGQVLIILPVSGTIHTVAKGDTLKSIAKKYKADAVEIAQFNNLDSNPVLSVGDEIIIPDGEGTTQVAGATRPRVRGNPFRGGSGPNLVGYYIRPLIGGIKTQGLHGYNGIDIGTHVGTPIMAAASGEIILARASGWNGGYGKYIIIAHPNGTQTVYGHLSQVFVNSGDIVMQGQTIGLSGNTGNSTGPHLHFEVRGAVNPLGP